MAAEKRKSTFAFWSNFDLPAWLFLGALTLYIVTRLIGLDQFPIYFFTDEANQTLSIATLVENDYRLDDVLLPTYFRNGLYINLGLSVYAQWLPYMVFGKSAVVTRMTSVLITMIAALSIGLILRNIFKLKHWWMGTLLLSITPAWFLHSRTAFETAEFVAYYSGALYAYLRYRHHSPRYLYTAFFFAACAFYTYSPAQFIVPLTAMTLAFSDRGYHVEHRRTVLRGIGLAFVLGLPYLRFIFYNPHVPLLHLSTLGSYWVANAPLTEKFAHYASEYAMGISPGYWYLPNGHDLSRHLMKGYGHIMLVTLPFAFVGLLHILRRIRMPESRTLLLAILVSPVSAALVGISITRSLLFVIPASMLTTIGFEKIVEWLKAPRLYLEELAGGSGPNRMRIVTGLLILAAGSALGFKAPTSLDRIVLWALSIFLFLWSSGVEVTIARWAKNIQPFRMLNPSDHQLTGIAIIMFSLLSGLNIWMLNDALKNGPYWFNNYGFDGMQYGAFQIFSEIEQYQQEHPESNIIFTQYWANGPDVLVYFFLGYPPPIQIGSVRDLIDQKYPFDDSIVFITTPLEYQAVMESHKFTDVQTEKIVPYPDGSPGFYFIRMRYVEDVDAIFAAEAFARHVLQESNLTIAGEKVKIRHSKLDSVTPEKTIANLFDGDPLTLAKTVEANPFVVELTYPSPHTVNGFSIVTGAANVTITLTGYAQAGAEPVVYTFKGHGLLSDPELSFDLPEPLIAQILRIELLDVENQEPAIVHMWEIAFR